MLLLQRPKSPASDWVERVRAAIRPWSGPFADNRVETAFASISVNVWPTFIQIAAEPMTEACCLCGAEDWRWTEDRMASHLLQRVDIAMSTKHSIQVQQPYQIFLNFHQSYNSSIRDTHLYRFTCHTRASKRWVIVESAMQISCLLYIRYVTCSIRPMSNCVHL